jgi:hypothetical protein
MEILGGWSPIRFRREDNPWYKDYPEEQGTAYGCPTIAIPYHEDGRRRCYGGHDYSGPFFLAGHPANDENPHGYVGEPVEFGGHGIGWPGDKAEIFDSCVKGVSACDVVFCWLDDWTAFGTLVELGMAHALGKCVVIASTHAGSWRHDGLVDDDLWFAYYCGSVPGIVSDSPLAAYKEFLIRHGESVAAKLERQRADSTYRELEALKAKMARVSGSRSAAWRELVTDWNESGAPR